MNCLFSPCFLLYFMLTPAPTNSICSRIPESILHRSTKKISLNEIGRSGTRNMISALNAWIRTKMIIVWGGGQKKKKACGPLLYKMSTMSTNWNCSNECRRPRTSWEWYTIPERMEHIAFVKWQGIVVSLLNLKRVLFVSLHSCPKNNRLCICASWGVNYLTNHVSTEEHGTCRELLNPHAFCICGYLLYEKKRACLRWRFHLALRRGLLYMQTLSIMWRISFAATDGGAL